jgi:hypothetical protein
MKGTILNLEFTSGSGIIVTNEGQRFNFLAKDWKATAIQPAIGLEVDFIGEAGNATEIFSTSVSIAKKRVIFIILSIMCGFLGVNNFYAGYTFRGIMKIVTILLSVAFIVLVHVYYFHILFLPILSFLTLFITFIWSYLEVIFVTKDANGIKMVE